MDQELILIVSRIIKFVMLIIAFWAIFWMIRKEP